MGTSTSGKEVLFSTNSLFAVSAKSGQFQSTHSIGVWMRATSIPSVVNRERLITPSCTFAGVGKSNGRKRRLLIFAHGAGSWSVRIPGSTAPAVCSSAGKRRPRILSRFFILLVLSSFLRKLAFSEKLLARARELQR